MFAARVHNNTLGSVVEVDTYERGIQIIMDWCEEQNFELTEEDIDELENTFQYYNDDDSDNIFTFCLGDIERDSSE